MGHLTGCSQLYSEAESIIPLLLQKGKEAHQEQVNAHFQTL